MKICLAAVLAIALSAGPAACGDLSKRPIESLIDDLTTLDASVPGIDDTGTYEAFLAEDAPPRFEAGLLPPHPPSIHPAMRELVRRGAASLPALIAHLSDTRPTGLDVGLELDYGFIGQVYTDEYDPRIGVGCRSSDCLPENADEWFIEMSCTQQCLSFTGRYVVKVGDVCEVLIGQIVNRKLPSVRYLPSKNMLYVNSPIEQPSLVARIHKDWDETDSAGLEAALLEDLRVHPKRFLDGALRRLRFYYPKTYAALSGPDLEKRQAFEAKERAAE